jgi:hypothetical protein
MRSLAASAGTMLTRMVRGGATVLAAMLAAGASGPACADQIVRSVDRDGRVLYSDVLPPGARETKRLPVRMPTRAEVEQARLREETRVREQTAFQSRQRERELQFLGAEADLRTARNELAAAQRRRTAGEEPRANEVLGNAGGGARLGDAYIARQAALAADVARAERRVVDAQAKFNALR